MEAAPKPTPQPTPIPATKNPVRIINRAIRSAIIGESQPTPTPRKTSSNKPTPSSKPTPSQQVRQARPSPSNAPWQNTTAKTIVKEETETTTFENGTVYVYERADKEGCLYAPDGTTLLAWYKETQDGKHRVAQPLRDSDGNLLYDVEGKVKMEAATFADKHRALTEIKKNADAYKQSQKHRVEGLEEAPQKADKRDEYGLRPEAVIGITNAKWQPDDDDDTTKKTLHVAIKVRPSAQINPQQVTVAAYVYEKDTSGTPVVVSSEEKRVNTKWLSPLPSWTDNGLELLDIEYTTPSEASKNKLYGYTVAIYYHNLLQDVTASPATLLRQDPPRRSLEEVTKSDETPQTVDSQSPSPTPPKQPSQEFLYGTPVPDKPGYVTSPHAPYSGYVDVRGLTVDMEVRCPYSQKIFRVPSTLGKDKQADESVISETSETEALTEEAKAEILIPAEQILTEEQKAEAAKSKQAADLRVKAQQAAEEKKYDEAIKMLEEAIGISEEAMDTERLQQYRDLKRKKERDEIDL